MSPQRQQAEPAPQVLSPATPDQVSLTSRFEPAEIESPSTCTRRYRRLGSAVRKITDTSSWLTIVILFAVLLVGWADYATSPDITLTLFYILPIAAAAWFGSRRLGFLIAFASAAAWFTAGTPDRAELSQPVIHAWNATSRLLVYSLIAFLFSSLRKQRDQLEEAVQQKTIRLRHEVAQRARVEREVINVCAHEQRRIAYDLHDNLGGHLVGIALKAKLLEQKLRPVRPQEAEALSEIVGLITEATKQTRLTARELDGSDGVGDLETALQRLAADARRNCRVRAMVHAHSPLSEINTPVAVQLYRIAQEAVHNAVEHGAAKKVNIELISRNGEIVLTVRDNGRGFTGDGESDGMGLRIMQYRAQCIGGSCDVHSTRASGTTVTCRVPLSAGGV